MKVKVEGCWSGHENYSWRLTTPDGQRVVVGTSDIGIWTRRDATACLDSLERELGLPRDSVRFNHI